MIHYHGTPIGGTADEKGRFLVGRHALVPFKYKDDLGAVLGFCQSFCLDNSAFTMWKAGEIKTETEINDWFWAYHDWCKLLHRHPSYDFCLIPDMIDGTEQQNKDLVYKWMRTGNRVRGIPVYHMHESLEYLAELVDLCDMIAIGSSGVWPNPGTPKWWARMDEIMRVCCDNDGEPKTRIHGLRMLDPDIFRKLPLRSADSTNAAVNSGSIKRFGMYIPPTTSQRAAVIADRIEMFHSSAIYEFHPQKELI